ncbi:hypothetical protein Btru_011709 [Bulinus truncatus]|nr:hypothetical protein Btru_011709 [Bulinus truncatus]
MMKCVILFVILVISVKGQHQWVHQCPLCANPWDPASCTGVKDCHNTHEICMFKLDMSLSNRVDYYCTNLHLCENYASGGCDFSSNQACYFCCLDVPSCNQQREALFMGITHGKK